MSLLDVDAIDYIGINNLFRRVYVGIFDDLAWDNDAQHFALLTKKIDRYTQYIRSGQLLAAYPRVRGYPVTFEYVAMRPMTQSAEAFWKTREAIIRLSGYEVRFRTVDVRPSLEPKAQQAADADTAQQAADADALHGPHHSVLVLHKKRHVEGEEVREPAQHIK
jgi:hypothetical protein